MANIKIRFNTKYLEGNPDLKWRVLINNKEVLARNVHIEVPSFTSEDTIEGGEIKWHISCEGQVHWQEDIAIIKKS